MLVVPRPYASAAIPFGAATLQALYQTRLNANFPSGLPTYAADVVAPWTADPSPFPATWASCTRYTFSTNVGGRGNTGTPLYAFLIRPVTTPYLPVLFIQCIGHGCAWTYDPNTSIADELREEGYLWNPALSAGMPVLVIEMPQLGHNPNPLQTVVNGTLQSYTYTIGHDLSAIDADGGPTANEMFVWHLICGINQALIEPDLHIQHVACVGFSGGCMPTTLAAALDRRIGARYCIATESLGILNNTNNWSDWEQDEPQNTKLYGANLDRNSLFCLGALGGRRAIFIASDRDSGSPAAGLHESLTATAQQCQQALGTDTGTCEIWFTNDPTTHEIVASEGTQIVADIRATFGV